MIRSRSLLVLLCALVALAGCTRYPGGVAASTVPLSPGGYTVIGPVSATDCKVNLLGLIPLSGGNRVHQAIDKAKRKRSADALIGVTVDRASKFFLLWTQTCTEVHATAVSIN